MKHCFIFLLSLCILGCSDNPLPKPKGYLRLDYPPARYKEIQSELPFTFEKNELSESISKIKTLGGVKGVNILYPQLKATIYLSYKTIEENNLDNLLRDAQNLTQKHTLKADEIAQQEFLRPKDRVFGMLYEVGGNAASQSQFYLTDSISHFLSGSLYFYAKPNYDSIYPASEYLKKDIRRLMETIRWTK